MRGRVREGGNGVPKELARALRSKPTEAERALWQHLRRRRISGHRFRRQHPLGPYIVDFVCLEAQLVIEVDGSQHVDQQVDDAVRTQWLESRGFRVLRFWNNQVLGELAAVEQAIQIALEGEPPPSLTLPLKGGGDQ